MALESMRTSDLRVVICGDYTKVGGMKFDVVELRDSFSISCRIRFENSPGPTCSCAKSLSRCDPLVRNLSELQHLESLSKFRGRTDKRTKSSLIIKQQQSRGSM